MRVNMNEVMLILIQHKFINMNNKIMYQIILQINIHIIYVSFHENQQIYNVMMIYGELGQVHGNRKSFIKLFFVI
jgi:hypothetical protein